jgi:hypothetical protein
MLHCVIRFRFRKPYILQFGWGLRVPKPCVSVGVCLGIFWGLGEVLGGSFEGGPWPFPGPKALRGPKRHSRKGHPNHQLQAHYVAFGFLALNGTGILILVPSASNPFWAVPESNQSLTEIGVYPASPSTGGKILGPCGEGLGEGECSPTPDDPEGGRRIVPRERNTYALGRRGEKVRIKSGSWPGCQYSISNPTEHQQPISGVFCQRAEVVSTMYVLCVEEWGWRNLSPERAARCRRRLWATMCTSFLRTA